MRTLFAVYHFGWRVGRVETAVGDGVRRPARDLIGLYRDRARAERVARRFRRAWSVARRKGDPVALIEVATYDPFGYVSSDERWGARPTRAAVHRRLVGELKERRARLGIVSPAGPNPNGSAHGGPSPETVRPGAADAFPTFR